MSDRFRLFWFREGACHFGTPVNEKAIDPVVRGRILALVRPDERDIEVHMPFLDKRELNRREESLHPVEFRREGNVIRPISTTANSQLRNHAAALLQLHPAWKQAPRDRRSSYFPTWQRVSVHLQRELRRNLLERHMSDIEALEDRPATYPVLVFAASRPCFGRPRTEFTYDIAEPETLAQALKLMNKPLQALLAQIEQQLHAAGKSELARRYAPIWHEDIRREILKNPRSFLMMLGNEASFINSVIDLGTSGQMSAVKPFARRSLIALRNIYGMDLRDLTFPILNGATEVLTDALARYKPRSRRRTTSQSESEEQHRWSSAPGTSCHYTPGNAISL